MGIDRTLPLRRGATVTFPPDMAACDETKRYIYRCHIPDVAGVWQPYVHRPCLCNEHAALVKRTLGETVRASDSGLLAFERAARRLRRLLNSRITNVEPWSHQEVVASYPAGRLRNRYERARMSLLADGYCGPEDARIKAFVKSEKYNPLLLKCKPRLIMARTPRYNLELAAYLKPFEHAAYAGMRGRKDLSNATTTRWIAKGLDGTERACLIRRKLAGFKDPRVFEVDGRAFEAHFCREVLISEHRWYNNHFRSGRLARLLSYQLENVGRTEGGLRYRAPGVRASGDFNTGLGNTLTMCTLVLVSHGDVELAKGSRATWDTFADGDNALIFVEAADLDIWTRVLPGSFLKCGFEAEVGRPTGVLEEVEFGQSRPVRRAAGWTMVRNPYKVLSGAYCGHRHYGELSGGLRILRCVAMCEAFINRGVPVLQAYAHAMLKATRHLRLPRSFEPENYEYQCVVRNDNWQKEHWDEVSLESRLGFARAWGIPVEEQMRLEGGFKIDLPSTWFGAPWDGFDESGLDVWDAPQVYAATRWLDGMAT